MTEKPRRTKAVAMGGFVLVTMVLWLPTIAHNFGGFVSLSNAQTVGADVWAALVWAAFLYAAWHLLRAFRPDLATDIRDLINKKGLDSDTAGRLLKKHHGDWNAAIADAEEQGYRISKRWQEKASASR